MGLIVRLFLFIGSAVASLLIARSSANFPIVSALFGILAVVILVVMVVMFSRRD